MLPFKITAFFLGGVRAVARGKNRRLPPNLSASGGGGAGFQKFGGGRAAFLPSTELCSGAVAPQTLLPPAR